MTHMGAITIQAIWEEMVESATGNSLPYPCNQAPGLYKDKEGKGDYIITAANRIRVSELSVEELGARENIGLTQVFQPKVYQDCMNPEQIMIYPLKITQPQPGCLLFNDHFEESLVELKGKKVEVCPWKAEIHKAGCVPCTNCGKCGW